MRIGLKLRASLIVAPLVVAMLALAVALIGSYLSLRAALYDVRREIAFLLHLSRRGSIAPASAGDVRAGYRALNETVGGLAGLDPRRDRAEVIRIYESQLEPLGNEALPSELWALEPE